MDKMTGSDTNKFGEVNFTRNVRETSSSVASRLEAAWAAVITHCWNSQSCGIWER